jgi:hypothetical protein
MIPGFGRTGLIRGIIPKWHYFKSENYYSLPRAIENGPVIDYLPIKHGDVQ